MLVAVLIKIRPNQLGSQSSNQLRCQASVNLIHSTIPNAKKKAQILIWKGACVPGILSGVLSGSCPSKSKGNTLTRSSNKDQQQGLMRHSLSGSLAGWLAGWLVRWHDVVMDPGPGTQSPGPRTQDPGPSDQGPKARAQLANHCLCHIRIRAASAEQQKCRADQSRPMQTNASELNLGSGFFPCLV